MSRALRAGLLVLVMAGGCNGGEPPTDPAGADPTTTSPRTSATTQGLALTTSATGLAVKTTAKGKQVELDGRFQAAVVVRRAADGTLASECHDEQAEADAFLAAPVAARASGPELQ